MTTTETNGKMSNKSYKLQIVWINVILMILYHILALQGLYYLLFLKAKWQTAFWTILIAYVTGLGTTAGVHRLWSHRSYKAKLPFRIILCIFQTMALQNSIYIWSRDHRAHHKFSDTDADPHNASRGFFFSHMGWLMVRKHPEVLSKKNTIYLKDLEEEALVYYQHKYYTFIAPILCFIFPTFTPWYLWNENLYIAFTTAGIFRYVFVLHTTWSVNSVAHLWGYKPYDKNIKPAENIFVSTLTSGEGWHNYHHAFPWDYKAAELDSYTGNLTTGFIDMIAKIGWVYDRRAATKEMIEKRIETTG